MKGLILGLAMLSLAGCASMRASVTGGSVLPTAAQMMGACAAEKAAKIKPDCNLYYVTQSLCNAQTIANGLNPIITAGASAATGSPLAGAILNGAAIINTTACANGGFYSTPPVVAAK